MLLMMMVALWRACRQDLGPIRLHLRLLAVQPLAEVAQPDRLERLHHVTIM